jgi:mannose-6-phosphate isomerase-like protein (cupin superfamily)
VSGLRPRNVGQYELLRDFANSAASVRILRMNDETREVVPHLHHRSAQIYVVLSGKAAIEIDGVEHILGMNEIVSVPVRSLHSARPVDGPAVLMNISVPPLAVYDQAPALAAHEASDLRIPREGADVED